MNRRTRIIAAIALGLGTILLLLALGRVVTTPSLAIWVVFLPTLAAGMLNANLLLGLPVFAVVLALHSLPFYLLLPWLMRLAKRGNSNPQEADRR